MSGQSVGHKVEQDMLDGMHYGEAYGTYRTNTGRGTATPAPALRQRTLKTAIDCTGTGLHGGDMIAMKLTPAEPDTGIVFRRIDLKNGARDVPASFDRVIDTRLCTTLGNDHGTRVATVEHLMAAISGCGIDNAVIELDGPEVPIMDGSSEPFVFLIDCAGTVEQNAPRRTVMVRRPISIEDGEASAALAPADSFTINLGIDFESTAIGRQELFLEVSGDSFKNEICRARTFGFLNEVEALRAAGLARGGSLENAVVVDGNRIVNTEGLRFEDEFVRHKVLDCVGDMALAGHPVTGHFRGRRTGHGLNNRLLRTLFADDANWTLVPVEELTGLMTQRAV